MDPHHPRAHALWPLAVRPHAARRRARVLRAQHCSLVRAVFRRDQPETGLGGVPESKESGCLTHRFFDLMRYRLCVYASGTFNHFFLNLLYVLANCPQAALISLP